jgi:hypothetical protein
VELPKMVESVYSAPGQNKPFYDFIYEDAVLGIRRLINAVPVNGLVLAGIADKLFSNLSKQLIDMDHCSSQFSRSVAVAGLLY